MKLIATALALILILGLPAGLLAQTSVPSGQPSGGSTVPSGDQPAASGSGSTTSSGAPAATPGEKSSGPDAASGSSNTQVTTPTAPSGRAGDTNVQIDRRDDTPAASPRTSGSETRIFGVSPLVAVLIAAALLVVVILAIVSMSRGGSTHSERIDIDRRL